MKNKIQQKKTNVQKYNVSTYSSLIFVLTSNWFTLASLCWAIFGTNPRSTINCWKIMFYIYRWNDMNYNNILWTIQLSLTLKLKAIRKVVFSLKLNARISLCHITLIGWCKMSIQNYQIKHTNYLFFINELT